MLKYIINLCIGIKFMVYKKLKIIIYIYWNKYKSSTVAILAQEEITMAHTPRVNPPAPPPASIPPDICIICKTQPRQEGRDEWGKWFKCCEGLNCNRTGEHLSFRWCKLCSRRKVHNVIHNQFLRCNTCGTDRDIEGRSSRHHVQSRHSGQSQTRQRIPSQTRHRGQSQTRQRWLIFIPML